MPENGGLYLSNWKCWIEVELVNLSSLEHSFARLLLSPFWLFSKWLNLSQI